MMNPGCSHRRFVPRPSRAVLVVPIALTLALSANLAMMTTASAREPGQWTQLSEFPANASYPLGTTTDEPAVARIAGALQVIWPGQQAPDRMSYYTAILAPNGSVQTPAREIVSDWVDLARNPAVTSVAGQQLLAFSGLQSTMPGGARTSGAEYSATSPDGVTWALSPGSLSATTSAYAGYGNAVVGLDATPVWVGNAGSTSGVDWHVGQSPSDPAPAGSDATFRLTGCCAYDAAAARDESTGDVYTAFYSNSSTPGESGVWLGRILPTQGPFTRVAGSSTVFNGADASLEPGQRVALAARSGGNVYVAVKVGYPTVRSIRLVNASTGAFVTVPRSAGASRIALAPGAGGRLWVAWVVGDRVKVAVTNAAVTSARGVSTLRAPRGSRALWSLAISHIEASSRDRLDVVVTADSVGDQVNVWHTQVRL